MIPPPIRARPAGTSAPSRRPWPAASLTRRPGNRADRRKCSQHSRRPQITAPRARMGDPVKTLLIAYAARPFPGRPESARAARVWVASYLPGSPVADDVALMVSELVTNALRYSRSGQPGGWVTVDAMSDFHQLVRGSVAGGSLGYSSPRGGDPPAGSDARAGGTTIPTACAAGRRPEA